DVLGGGRRVAVLPPPLHARRRNGRTRPPAPGRAGWRRRGDAGPPAGARTRRRRPAPARTAPARAGFRLSSRRAVGGGAECRARCRDSGRGIVRPVAADPAAGEWTSARGGTRWRAGRPSHILDASRLPCGPGTTVVVEAGPRVGGGQGAQPPRPP